MEHWGPFVYQYLVGGALAATPIVVAFKKRALRWNRRLDRVTFKILVGGYLFYFCLHMIWILWAVEAFK